MYERIKAEGPLPMMTVSMKLSGAEDGIGWMRDRLTVDKEKLQQIMTSDLGDRKGKERRSPEREAV